MSKNKLIFFVLFVGFSGLIINSLLKELGRNRLLLKKSISGLILSKPEISKSIVKTDNAHVFLFDSETFELVASKTINPFLPPLNFSIGQDDAVEYLRGSYRLLVLTDKNRKIDIPSVGEVIGPLLQPIALGTEGIKYYLDRPFQNLPYELLNPISEISKSSIGGTVYVSPNLLENLDSKDRLVIMLFDENHNSPVAIKILENFKPPQKFSIGSSNVIKGKILEGKFSLRILTDKNNQPFISSYGEIIGRSKNLIPLGTQNLEFKLDQEYVR